MRVRWLYLIVALIAAAFVLRPVARADLNYRTEITGVEDSELADLLEKVSELKTLEDRPPGIRGGATSPRRPRSRPARRRGA